MKKNKIKTKKSASSRFELTRNGKVKYRKAFKRHLLAKKSAKRKRHLRSVAVLSDSYNSVMRLMLVS